MFLLLLSGELPVSFVYGCFGISLVTVTYFSVLIDSVLASEYGLETGSGLVYYLAYCKTSRRLYSV